MRAPPRAQRQSLCRRYVGGRYGRVSPHRPLYDWILESLDLPRPLPRQIEFARLNIDYTVMSKRKLLQLVNEGVVHGWDDPRMPTISGIRRRGITPTALRNFVTEVGVT